MSGVVTASLLPDPPRRNEAEFALQQAVCGFLRVALPADCAWFSIPNGGLRHTKVAQKLAATGLKAGVPDLCVIYRRTPIFIELKTATGAVSQVQKQMHRRLVMAGAEVLVLRSVEGVENALREMGVPLRASCTDWQLRTRGRSVLEQLAWGAP
jgi:hypothetical protein